MKPAPSPPHLTRAHRWLIGVVVAGAVVIAGIGFAGSYAAVRELALQKGFGTFSYVLPIGIDAGICVLLALDLLLTWIRIPLPLLRQTAWLLTAATIAFNGAAAWPDPLGVAMHAVIPILFVVSVEAARHAIGQVADITASKHMEGVRLTRWLLSPVPTFLLWRRMKLWELRSYDTVIKLEQERLVYQARLHSRFGRAWRRKAPVESLMPLRLARYGVPLSDTAPAGLAGGIELPEQFPPTDARSNQDSAAAMEATQAARLDVSALAHLDSQHPQPDMATAQGSSFAEPVHTVHDQSADSIGSFEARQRCDSEDPVGSVQVPPTRQLPDGHDHRPLDDNSPSPHVTAPLEAADRAQKSAPHPAILDPREHRSADTHRATPGSQQAVPHEQLADAHPDETGGSRPDAPGPADRHTPDNPNAGLLPDHSPTEANPRGPGTDRPAAAQQEHGQHRKPAPVPTQRQRATVDAPLQPTSTQPGEHAAETDSSPELPAMKAPDHYYLAYTHYLDRHGREPKGATAYTELAQHLANQGIFGPTGRPVSASTLRRYALEQRIYHRWTHAYDTHGKPPTSEQLLQRLADDRVKAGNRPLTVHDLQRAEHLATGFHRRHTTLHHHNHPPQQPPRPTHTPPEDTATTPEPAGERQHHTTDDHPPLPTER